MKLINSISNNDCVVDNITIVDGSLNISIRCWNGEKLLLNFMNYKVFKEKNSVGEEIGDIVIRTQSPLIDELRTDVINGGGTIEEVLNIKNFIFMNAWNDYVMMEVLAESMESKKIE